MNKKLGPIIFSKMNPPSPWQPENGKVNLAVLGKLGEELCELGAAINRCIIQGVDEKHPVTGKPNKEWLEDEVADVGAGLEIIISHFNLDMGRMDERYEMKKEHKLAWHKLIKEV